MTFLGDMFCGPYRTMTIQFVSQRGQPLYNSKIKPRLVGPKCLLFRNPTIDTYTATYCCWKIKFWRIAKFIKFLVPSHQSFVLCSTYASYMHSYLAKVEMFIRNTFIIEKSEGINSSTERRYRILFWHEIAI